MVSMRSAGGWPLVAAFAAAAVLGASQPVCAASAPVHERPVVASAPGGPVVVSGAASTPTLMMSLRPAVTPPPVAASLGPSLRAPQAPVKSATRLRLRGELRVRHETRGVFDYRVPGTFGRLSAQTVGAGGDVSLVRTRAGADVRLAPRLRGSVGVEDARALDITGAAGTSLATFDLEHAWVEFDSLAGRRVSARIGRQPLGCSENHILGGGEWSNRGRAYDGARMRWAPARAAVEGFVAQVHDAGSRASRRGLSGIDVQWRTTRRFEAEGYHLERAWAGAAATSESGVTGGLFDATTGLRTRARLGLWELRTEGAVQRGRRAGDEIGAWFGDARLTACLNSAWRTRIAFERLSASGDRSPADGTYQRFAPLDRPGGPPDALAIRGLSNIVDWCGMLTAQTAPGWTVQAEVHQLSLASATDAWVDADGNAIRRDPAGASGTGLGQEFDVRVTWQAGPSASLIGVASRFSDGAFVQATGGGGAASGACLQVVLGY